MTRISLVSLWARKRRLAGTALAVVLGVAFLTGTLVLGDTLSANFDRLFAEVSAGTDVTLDAAIYSYSRSKGLFAGASLEGASITMDDSANEKVYGRKVTGKEILLEGAVQPNPTVEPFLAALREHVPAHEH